MDWDDSVTTVQTWWGNADRIGALSPRSAARYAQVYTAFSRYAAANGVRSPEAVTPDLCRCFVNAPLRGGDAPRTATSRLRLTALRSAFEVLVSTRTVSANPTDGLKVRQEKPARLPTPLTPSEAARLLVAMRVAYGAAPWPAICALALLGPVHAEIAATVMADLDEAAGHIVLGEGDAFRALPVPPALVEVLARRVAAQRVEYRRRGEPWDPAMVPLALSRPAASFPINCVAPTVSNNLGLALRHAGIHRAGVQPKSVREYAANELYATTQHIETVAEQLGLSSYDTAARLIDRAWQERWGETLRREARE
jgi:site-specific recombinase XerC